MISRSSRLLHVALVTTCGAGMVYAPALEVQTSITLQLGQPSYAGLISLGYRASPSVNNRGPQGPSEAVHFVRDAWYRNVYAPRCGAQPSGTASISGVPATTLSRRWW